MTDTKAAIRRMLLPDLTMIVKESLAEVSGKKDFDDDANILEVLDTPPIGYNGNAIIFLDKLRKKLMLTDENVNYIIANYSYNTTVTIEKAALELYRIIFEIEED